MLLSQKLEEPTASYALRRVGDRRASVEMECHPDVVSGVHDSTEM